jgi:hypothetical protein
MISLRLADVLKPIAAERGPIYFGRLTRQERLEALLGLPVELTQELHVRSDLQEEVVERRPFEG